MHLEKCKFNFMILQINLAIGYTIFIGIMDQVRYQSIVPHHVFTIFTTLQNQFHEFYNVISQRTLKHVQDSPNGSTHLASS